MAREGLPLPEPYDGYHADVCGLVEMADHVICLSEFERNALRAIGADMSASSVVLNPVEASLYAKPDPTLFQQAFGVSDYVLCVGRLEARKNQITLLHAMRESNIPVVLVGHAADPQYEKLLRSVAGPNVIFAGRIGSNSAMLGSAYAGARLTCQPSWSEGAPLVALEAAAAGCNMILSDRSSEQEYFGARARYVDPANPEQMLATILEAYESPFDDAQREELHHWTSENFNWERHIEGTAAAYERAAAEVSARRAPSAPTKVYVDLTSSANRSGPPSGIARVEERYARELYDLMPDQVQFVLWNGDRQQFVEVSPEQFERAEHRLLCGNRAPDYLFNSQDFHPAGLVQFEPNSVLLVLGGAWIRNARYVQSLVATKREMGLTFVAFIHDVIQAKFKHWFPDKVGDEFSENCRLLIDSVDHVLVNSQCTLRDVREFCDGTGLIPPPMDFVRFGDEIDTSIGLLENPQYDRVVPLLNGRDFILCVSAIDIRKNHVLLYNIWERLIEEYGEKTPHLIMVGSKGWSIDPFLESVAKNKTLQKYFHILNGINDATLDWLYRNSLFTVYPSLYEGWGLPVAEALNYGKIAVAARAGSVPEIAPDFTDLIDPFDFPTWYKTICAYAFNEKLRASREEVVRQYKPLTWRASARTLYETLQNIQTLRKPLPDWKLGQRLGFDVDGDKRDQTRTFLVGGWSNTEKQGTWTLGTLARLRFRLRGKASGAPLVLLLEGRGFAPGARMPQRFDVLLQGEVVARLAWEAGAMTQEAILLPNELSERLLRDPEVSMHLRISSPKSPSELSGSVDTRKLGVMISKIEFRELNAQPAETWVDASQINAKNIEGPFVFYKKNKIGLSLYCQPNYSDLPASGFLYFGMRYIISTADGKKVQRGTIDVSDIRGRITSVPALLNALDVAYVGIPVEKILRGEIIFLQVDGIDGLTDVSIFGFGIFKFPSVYHPIELKLGETVHFAGTTIEQARKAGMKIPPLRDLQLTGWSSLQPEGTWSDGQVATMAFKVAEPPAEGGILDFEGMPYVNGAIGLSVGEGAPIWFETAALCQEHFMVGLTSQQLRANPVKITVQIAQASSLEEVKSTADVRHLGVQAKSLTLRSVADMTAVLEPVPVNSVSLRSDLAGVEFAGESRAAVPAYLGTGWWEVEDKGVWTRGRSASVLLNVNPDMAGSTLVFGARTFIASSIEIWVNGNLRALRQVEPEVRTDCELVLTPEDVEADYLLVTLICDAAASPALVGHSQDSRTLGMFLSLPLAAGIEAEDTVDREVDIVSSAFVLNETDIMAANFETDEVDAVSEEMEIAKVDIAAINAEDERVSGAG